MPRGTSLLDSLLRDTTTPAGLVGGDAAIADVSAAQLDESIAALERGDIEYLGLHAGEAFVQVAGEGIGPYQLEVSPGRVEDQVQVPGGTTIDGVRHALHGYLAGDPTWTEAFAWSQRRPRSPAGHPVVVPSALTR